jgi:hypothetical protein
MTRALVMLVALWGTLDARADTLPSASVVSSAPAHRWRRYSLGLQLGVANTPGGHVGIPAPPYASYGPHVPFALTFRAELNRWSAINAGLGVAHVGLGLTLWGGYELYRRLATDRRGIVGFELYSVPGLQLGFAGADWAARHGNDWVGFEYTYQGPLAFAMRLAMGARLVFIDRFDAYLEAVPIVTFTPSVEPLFTLVAGARIRF